MNNSFTVTVEFSFKGETFVFTEQVDLDSFMARMNGIPNLHDLIAKHHNIDSYSYQYEVLHAEELQFTEIKGFAGDFIHDSEFDAEGFAEAWREQRAGRVVSDIAAQVMGITDLDGQPQLKQALLTAYHAGQEQPLQHHE